MVALIVCCGCARQREISEGVRKNLVCSNCGAQKPRIIYLRKSWHNWENIDGKNKIEAMREIYAGLIWLRDARKYSEKYPLAKFRAIFGCWPPYDFDNIPALPPTSGLLNWLHRSNEVWKRQKRSEEKAAEPEVVLKLPEPEPPIPSWMTDEDWLVKL